eukprot:GHVS01095058.1.p1 GENE.GHVS01095058.1~~GHVS01095058.1.p1  ORF type:complete len:345 (+),score=48.26 GHVS01095058.1:152-1186(+)
MASLPKLVLLLPLLLLGPARCVPVEDVEFSTDMVAGAGGAMRGSVSSGLAVLKGYMLSFGHVFPSLPYYSFPWTAGDIDSFLSNHYDALDAGSTQAIENRFAKDALLLLDVRSDAGVVEDSVTKGKGKIVSKLTEWIANRGAVTVPTTWNVLSYRHPMVIVEGQVTFATQGACSFVQSFVFSGSKVGLTGQVVKSGTAPSAAVPAALSDLLNSLYADLDDKKTAVAEANFPDGYTSILFHRYPKDNSTFHLFSKDLKGFVRLANIYFSARGQAPTKTRWSLVKYLFPKIWVELTVEQPANSGTVLSTALMGYKLDEKNGNFQLLGDLSVLEFGGQTLMEFFLTL